MGSDPASANSVGSATGNGSSVCPFMIANAKAVANGEDHVDCLLDGNARWKQPSFKYQAKCFQWLREEYGSLSTADRQVVDGFLQGSGCAAMLSSDAFGGKARL